MTYIKHIIALVLLVPMLTFAQTTTTIVGDRMKAEVLIWVSPHIQDSSYQELGAMVCENLVYNRPIEGVVTVQPGTSVPWEMNNSYVRDGVRYGTNLRFAVKLSRTDGKDMRLADVLAIVTSDDPNHVFNQVHVYPPERYSAFVAGVRYGEDGEVVDVTFGAPNTNSFPVIVFAGYAKGFVAADENTRQQTEAYFDRYPTRYGIVWDDQSNGAHVHASVIFGTPIRIYSITPRGDSLVITTNGKSLQSAKSPHGPWQKIIATFDPFSQGFTVPIGDGNVFYRAKREP